MNDARWTELRAALIAVRRKARAERRNGGVSPGTVRDLMALMSLTRAELAIDDAQIRARVTTGEKT